MNRTVGIGIQKFDPRRFGKTLNMSMINALFSVDYQERTDV